MPISLGGKRILLVVNTHSRRGKEPLDPALGVFARLGSSVEVAKATARSMFRGSSATAGDLRIA